MKDKPITKKRIKRFRCNSFEELEIKVINTGEYQLVKSLPLPRGKGILLSPDDWDEFHRAKNILISSLFFDRYPPFLCWLINSKELKKRVQEVLNPCDSISSWLFLKNIHDYERYRKILLKEKYNREIMYKLKRIAYINKCLDLYEMKELSSYWNME